LIDELKWGCQKQLSYLEMQMVVLIVAGA